MTERTILFRKPRFNGSTRWIIIADAVGVFILVVAACSPMLKEWMFVILTAVPVVSSFVLLKMPVRKLADTNKTFINKTPIPISERKIVIAPRVAEWEPYTTS